MSNQRRVAQSSSTAIQQSVATGKHFTGEFPGEDSPLVNYNIYKYAQLAADGGGLFFWDCNEAVVVSQFHLDMGASADATLYLVNLDPDSVKAGTPTVISGESILIEQQTGARFMALDEARFKTILLPFQALQLITTASAGAQIAQCVASLERTYIR